MSVKKVRYCSFIRKVGNSLFILIPSLIQRDLELDNKDQIMIKYYPYSKKIIITKA